MIKYTKTTLQKLVSLFEQLDYTVRFEKGHFQSGYALVHDKKIAVINKFFDTESRILALIEIIGQISIDESKLDKKTLSFYKVLLKDGLIKTEES